MSSTSDRIQKFLEDAKSLLVKVSDSSSSSSSSSAPASTSLQSVEFVNLDVLLSGSLLAKTIAEIKRLRTWMQKHQSESVPDGAKAKLLAAVDFYYRFFLFQFGRIKTMSAAGNEKKLSAVRDQLHEGVHSLVSDYLQMPEGKLLSGRDKKKALTWIEGLVKLGAGEEASITTTSSSSSVNDATWILQGINDDGTIILLNSIDCELWKESVRVLDKSLLVSLRTLQAEADLLNDQGQEGEESSGGGGAVGNVYVELDEADRAVRCYLNDS
eukprot:gene23421-31766_t